MAAAGDAASKTFDVSLTGDDVFAVPVDRSRFLRLHSAPGRDGDAAPLGTAIVIHGGYWKNRYGLDDEYFNAGTGTLAPFFVKSGFSAVELEYRRRDHDGGGWPGTNDDILAAIQRITELRSAPKLEALVAAGVDEVFLQAIKALRPDRLVLIGHSAGGCLALWAGHALARESVSRSLVVLAAAPVADLVRGHEMKVSDEGDAVELYMKCKPEGEAALQEYAKASPAALLPASFPLLVVFGEKDADVPPELIRGYVSAATEKSPAGMVQSVQLPDSDHFDIVQSGSSAWKSSIVPALADLVERAFDAEAANALRSQARI
eukprot:TRINITY_DN35248_c0_g1_i2.p1 TRINITY_DN35248_c0_g1~~TRINITY_DN35248_c0_g1_i2.p1  ORF type:complete len:319 (+),score=63.20 TRINITY_DN35248_c0_g1_i2:85-1041(+)